MKKCRECKEIKTVGYFREDARTSDGKCVMCKDCEKDLGYSSRGKNIERKPINPYFLKRGNISNRNFDIIGGRQ